MSYAALGSPSRELRRKRGEENWQGSAGSTVLHSYLHFEDSCLTLGPRAGGIPSLGGRKVVGGLGLGHTMGLDALLWGEF